MLAFAMACNSEAIAYGGEGFHFDTTDGCGFTFVDFLPEVEKQGGFFTKSSFESFRTLVERANGFLRSNRKWKVVTCESIEFKSSCDRVDPFKMTYLEYGEWTTYFIRGLRLWLTERRDEKESEQQIDYFNLIPQTLEEGGIFSSPKFETLDALIARFNSMQHSRPLPGRIITIESQEMKTRNLNKFDPDRSNWSERGESIKSFVFVIRIFYEIMSGRSEEIGITDFTPDAISQGGIFSLPKYEPFSNLVNKATAWCAQQQDLRYCNTQTLEMKCKRGKQVDSQRMDYTEHGSMTTYYVRVLRIAYTKPYSISEKPSLIRQLSVRTFLPVQLTTGIFMPKYENLVATRERISSWVKATGARVLSAETTTYRVMTGRERKEGSEATFSYSLGERNEYWIYVIRLYMDGIYREPPPEMLPAIPVPENRGCYVS